ncbi:MAG: hypothetical protein JWO89_2543 [Verrucomicrobiaceae bacterium]|nr:hypothetical protein [Verrucomicrobiaceae bacterium]
MKKPKWVKTKPEVVSSTGCSATKQSPPPHAMKKSILSVIALLLCIPACSSLVSTATVERCDYRTIQGLGGIAVGPLRLNKVGHMILPVMCNVSGTRKITCTPSNLQSAAVCRRPAVVVRDGAIHLTIRSSLVAEGYSASCPDVDLGRLKQGSYVVYYRDPDGTDHPVGIADTGNLGYSEG